MNEEEIKKKLSPEEYHVLREKGTEAPFSGALLHEKRSGMYSCKVCGQELFSSKAKLDSSAGPATLAGWPSFKDAIPGAVKFETDNSYGMHRTEAVCANCGSHLGHVFDDSHEETGKHYCVNSVCLELKADVADTGQNK